MVEWFFGPLLVAAVVAFVAAAHKDPLFFLKYLYRPVGAVLAVIFVVLTAYNFGFMAGVNAAIDQVDALHRPVRSVVDSGIPILFITMGPLLTLGAMMSLFKYAEWRLENLSPGDKSS